MHEFDDDLWEIGAWLDFSASMVKLVYFLFNGNWPWVPKMWSLWFQFMFSLLFSYTDLMTVG